MSGRPNHTIAGLAFVGVCVVLAVIIYVLAQPTSRASTGNSSADATTIDDTIATHYLPPSVEEYDLDASGSGTTAPAVPPSLGLQVGQSYAQARRRLISLGFTPVADAERDCSPYGTSRGEECFDRPEISECSGTGKGYCGGLWARGGLQLSVTTVEGPDGALESAQFMRNGKSVGDPGPVQPESPRPTAPPPRTVPDIGGPTASADINERKPVPERVDYVASCMAAEEREQGGFGSSIDKAIANATCECSHAHFPPDEMTKAQFIGARAQCLGELSADRADFIGRYYLGGR